MITLPLPAIGVAKLPLDFDQTDFVGPFAIAYANGVPYRIDFETEPTEAERNEAIAAVEAWPLLSARAAKIEEMRSACEATIYSGFSSMALGEVHTYSSQEQDQTNLVGSVTLAGILGASVPYVCTDQDGLKIGRLHTVAQMQQVMVDGGARKQTLMLRFHELREQVEVATTVESVEAIAWSEND